MIIHGSKLNSKKSARRRQTPTEFSDRPLDVDEYNYDAVYDLLEEEKRFFYGNEPRGGQGSLTKSILQQLWKEKTLKVSRIKLPPQYLETQARRHARHSLIIASNYCIS